MSLHSFAYDTQYKASVTNATLGPFLDRIVPKFIRVRLASRVSRGSIQVGSEHGLSNFFVGFNIPGGGRGPQPNMGFVLIDDQGNEFDAGIEAASMGFSADVFEVYQFPAFPRRGKQLRLSFREVRADGSAGKALAEFSLPNPRPGPHQVWTPEPLPATRTAGDLAVTLTDFRTGLADEHLPDFAQKGVRTTVSQFTVLAGGRAEHAWRPRAVEVFDATGNHWEPPLIEESTKTDRQQTTLTFVGSLWPGESAWKLRVEFSRVADFSSEELWTLAHVQVPPPTEVSELKTSYEVNGTIGEMVAIGGTNAELPGIFKPSTTKGQVNLAVRCDARAQQKRLTLVRVLDDRDRAVVVTERFPDEAYRTFVLKVPADSRELNFTFAVHRSRFVDFVARPEQVGRNLAGGAGHK